MSTLENITLTGKIKSAFIMDERIDSSDINVDTVGTGNVILRGSVPTDVQKRLAEDIARLNGAHSVENRLTFKKDIEVDPVESPAAAGVYGRVTTPPGAPESGPPLPDLIMEALAKDDRVNAHLLRVELAEDNQIILHGRQGTVQERDAAVEVASRIPGVNGVISDIEILPAY